MAQRSLNAQRTVQPTTADVMKSSAGRTDAELTAVERLHGHTRRDKFRSQDSIRRLLIDRAQFRADVCRDI